MLNVRNDNDPSFNVYVIYDGSVIDEEMFVEFDDAMEHYHTVVRDWLDDRESFPPTTPGDGVYLYDTFWNRMVSSYR